MRLNQKQKTIPTLVKVGVAISTLAIITIIVFFIRGVFQPTDSSAIPSNAADFSETCYTVADGGSGLVEFNKYTGGPSDIGNTGIGSPEASTLNLIGDTLFVIDGNAGTFGYVNLSSGSFTTVNSNFKGTGLDGEDGKVYFEDIDAMTVNNNDVLWVASRDNNDTDPSYIAKMRHDGTFIENAFGIGVDYVKFDGPAGFPEVLDAMAYDPIDEVLFACANDGSGNPTYNNLMKVDPTNGKGVFVGNFNIGDVEGLGFDGEGNMYATTGTSSNNTANRNSFFSVNKKTAIATRVFTFSNGTDFETCDCIIGYKNTIRGTVFYDVDENGFIGNGESGLEGVTVNLYYDENNNGVYDSGTDGFIRSTTTDKLGNYVLVDAYDYGTLNYVITINTSDLPSGYALTTDNIETASFSSGGNNDLYNDFGYKLNAQSNNTITGYVYSDDDEDQIFDNGEDGLEGIRVNLYQDINQNGVYDDGTDIIVTHALTENDGSYSFTRPFVGGTQQLEIQVNGNNNDAEQDGNSMNLSSSDLDIGVYDVGMLFGNVAIPNNATIESAYIEFVSASVQRSVTSVSIYGEDSDNSSTFTSSNNNISSRTTTTEKVDWVIPYWNVANTAYQSPDISNVVQEIIDRNGWSTGNNMTLIIPEASGRRSAKTYNNSTTEAPKLFITYTDPSVSDNYLTFVDESTIPAGSEFTTDNIEVANFNTGGNTDPDNNFGVFQDQSLVNTVSGTVFRDSNTDGVLNTGDIGENSVSVCLFNDVNANGAYDASLDQLLQVKKTDVNGEYSFTEEYANTNITVASRVDRSSDDIDENPVSLTSSDLDFAQSTVGVRFNDLNIPQGATITEAYIEFTAEANKSGAYSFTVDGIDVDNASTFTSGQNLGNLPKTSSNATMSGSDSWTTNAVYTSPSLNSIVQEIVNRNGWSSGNSMGFLFNTGTGDRDAFTYNNDPAKAPNLVVSYASSGVNYVVIIKESNLPNGYALTTDNLEVASFNSGGNSDTGNDFGYELNTTGMNSVTGTVFNDNNQNQSFDAGESTVTDIKINLYADENCNGVLDQGEPLISNSLTDGNGFYEFYETYSNSLEKLVSQSSDDADESTLSTTDIDLDFAQSTVGVRFTNLNIPQGVNIVNAYIEFTAEANKSGTYSFVVEGVDTDNASTFSNGQNLNALTKTTATATMSGTESWTVNETYNSPSLTNIVQEIVDRSGWNENNAMSFVFSTGTGDRDAYSYDGDAAKAPKLIVVYEPSSLCYITQIENESISQAGTLTTSSTQTASFNSANNSDQNNDFGVYYAPLPVDLISFTGTWMGSDVSLDWTTATEINNEYFDVQWSADGVNFESIGRVEGFGNTLDEIDYYFVHNKASSVNFYRLKQNDFDGKYEYSPIIKLSKDLGSDIKVSASPNPFTSQLSVQIESPTAFESKLLINNISGSTLFEKEISIKEGGQNINIYEAESFEPGTYLIIIPLQNEVKTIKIIKK